MLLVRATVSLYNTIEIILKKAFSMQPSVRDSLPRGEHFFSRDPAFYKSFFRLFLLLTLQNIVTYSVNVADNVMLGSFSQTALSGAAAVNQIQYVLQQLINMGLCEGLIMLASQYWGRNDTDAIQRLTGIALCLGWAVVLLLTLAAFLCPRALVGLFTNDADILAEGVAYLSILRLSYLVFITTLILLAALRSMQIVSIAFRLSVMTLLVNAGINFVLIFGRFGFPCLGVRGAAIGTLIARCLELLVLLLYIRKGRLPVRFAASRLLRFPRSLVGDFLRVSLPCCVSSLLFSSAVAMQTAILGHLSSNALAANSAAGTLFQYCKMIPISASAAAGVFIGRVVGSGELSGLRGYVRTLQVLFLCIGLLVSGLLLAISRPLLSLYALTPQALAYARQIILVFCVTSIGTAYEMPSMCGICRGGGDSRFVMFMDIFFSWCVVVPLSVCAAFVLRLDIAAVVFFMNCDQILKCIPVFIKTNRYTFIKKLARTGAEKR